MLHVETTALPEVMLLRPQVCGDARGFFLESYNQRDFDAAVGVPARFVQDNHSRSRKGVLRGLHYQVRRPQGKLVRVLAGAIFDVAVDLRRDSERFGRWVGVRVDAQDHAQLWIPEGFAHGYLVLTDSADVAYKTTDYYAPEHERCLRYDDPNVGVRWPLEGVPLLSEKDAQGVSLAHAELT